MVKNTPQFSVVMHMSRIEIITNRAFKQGGVLRDDGKSASQVKQAYGGDIETVDTSVASQYASLSTGGKRNFLPDGACYGLNDAKQCQCQGTFAGSSTAHNAYLFVGLDVKRDISQHGVETFPIAG
jgi:hypothetical protein